VASKKRAESSLLGVLVAISNTVATLRLLWLLPFPIASSRYFTGGMQVVLISQFMLQRPVLFASATSTISPEIASQKKAGVFFFFETND
jgi:hypothetical protein